MKKRCMACLFLLLLLALPPGFAARAEAKAIDVLPGAFGESIDMLDDATGARCVEYADLAFDRLLADFALGAAEAPGEAYLEILHTTLLLPGTPPPGASDVERAIWAELYEGAACVVSFVALDNSLNLGDIPYAEVSGRLGDYIVRPDGSVESVSLRGVRSRFFWDPVVPGVRVINMGSHYNAHYTIPDWTGLVGAYRLDSGVVNGLAVGEFARVTVEENQTTPYRWVCGFSDEAVMECAYDAYVPDANPLGMPGVGGSHIFYFKAVGVGWCQVDLYLTRIGEGVESAVQQETYGVFVAESPSADGR